MKIAIDIRKIEDFGIGTHIFNLLKALSKIDKDNIYFLIGYKDSKLPELGENFHLITTTAGKYSITEHIKIPAILKKIGCDIFHSPHYVVPFFYRGKTTATIHDVIHLIFPSYLPKKIYRVYAYSQIKRTLKNSNTVFTVSHSSKKDILSFFPWAEKKIQVVYNGVDERFFEEDKKELVEKVKKELGRYALYVGNTKPHKNLEMVIRAMKKIKGKLKFLIVGGNPTKELLSFIEKENCKDDVIFKGFIPFEELSAYYKASEVFIFPSLYEGFGLPPLEAMAKGIPVLSSSAPSMPEILGNGAIYFDPRSVESLVEALNKIIENKESREKMSLEGKKIAKKYSWNESANKILQFWRNIK